MTGDERLTKLLLQGGLNFSIETIETKMGAQALVTITRKSGSNQDTVGGTYDTIEEGLSDCINKLDEMHRLRVNLTVIK